MSEFVIYHNPRCRKSRETLLILEQAGVDPEVYLYLETPLLKEGIAELCRLLGVRPIEITRLKEPVLKELGIDPRELSDDEMLEVLAEHPKLIERPIVVKGGKEAVMGRPPENVEVFLG